MCLGKVGEILKWCGKSPTWGELCPKLKEPKRQWQILLHNKKTEGISRHPARSSWSGIILNNYQYSQFFLIYCYLNDLIFETLCNVYCYYFAAVQSNKRKYYTIAYYYVVSCVQIANGNLCQKQEAEISQWSLCKFVFFRVTCSIAVEILLVNCYAWFTLNWSVN